MIRALAVALAGLLMTGSANSAEPTYQIFDFKDLIGWEADDHDAALRVFLNTCPDLEDPDWASLCAVAQNISSAKAFFELFFRPVLIQDGTKPLFTGYFEPELDGDTAPSDRFRFPVYRIPSEARENSVWLSRREIETSDTLRGRGLEIAWVDDPVELFFLQIQGSGRIKLPSGRHIRVGYAGANGHPYRSIGVELIRRGIYKPHQVSAQVIKSWVRRNPVDGAELLRHNPSYVFFRTVNQVPADEGPLGAMNRSVTEGRSIAVDPAFTPLGAPVWVEKAGKLPMNRLMIAQDTGSAIKGAQRADIFLGTGDTAGRVAGKLRDSGKMLVLLPIQRAFALLPEGGE
ncbi:murein transglycosylase A [Thalassovita taeanensis]|uniref:peptidoglycan lytic exotransglycosylase n=1 Tax=Thalassovita taeanensis TaxID=657014 RepID=A0A1H9JIL2_9RHOB|nr:MltA domain-containing protein [Thalassovita taeanensis]SEQ86744.1 membrane-bound lytic murein transglycosylase A [Thalassovita taeanensis]